MHPAQLPNSETIHAAPVPIEQTQEAAALADPAARQDPPRLLLAQFPSAAAAIEARIINMSPVDGW